MTESDCECDVVVTQVPLKKLLDVCVNISLLHNTIYTQYYTHAHKQGTTHKELMSFELCVVVVSAAQRAMFNESEVSSGVVSDTVVQAYVSLGNARLHGEYVLCGQPYSRHNLSDFDHNNIDSVSSSELQHNLRLCFLSCGAYSVFTLVRFSVAGDEKEGCWWTLPEATRLIVV